jgi:hypothetical protein
MELDAFKCQISLSFKRNSALLIKSDSSLQCLGAHWTDHVLHEAHMLTSRKLLHLSSRKHKEIS